MIASEALKPPSCRVHQQMARARFRAPGLAVSVRYHPGWRPAGGPGGHFQDSHDSENCCIIRPLNLWNGQCTF